MFGDEGRAVDPFGEGLSDALSSLKRTGSNLLVVGTVTGSAGAQACRRMLGDDAANRHRLLVLTDGGSTAVEDRLPAGCDHTTDGVTVIDHAIQSRSATATAPAAQGPLDATDSPSAPTLADHDGVADRQVDTTDLVDLGSTIAETIAEIDEAADGLEPADLRVCLDSLLPLLETNGEETVFRFLHVLTGQVRNRHGLAHYHLPVDPSSPASHLFAPLFDAVVELRAEDEVVQQRWHVRDAEVSTEWLAV